MKNMFIEVKSKLELDKNAISALKLPNKILIAYSIQFKNLALEIRDILAKTHEIVAFQQVLGCSKINQKDAEAVLLIGSGRFHAINLAAETKLPIYIYEAGKISKINPEEISSLEKAKKSAYIRFLSESKVGVLISTKPGQNKLKSAINLKKKIKDKKLYFFLANNLNPKEFENFQIKSWINTACPRLDMDNHSIINLSDLNISN